MVELCPIFLHGALLLARNARNVLTLIEEDKAIRRYSKTVVRIVCGNLFQ